MIGYYYQDKYDYECDVEPTDSVYSDRLYQWDYVKYNELCKKHFGNESQHWGGRSPEKIEVYLREYLNEPNLILCRVESLVNVSNGYPYWRFDFKK